MTNREAAGDSDLGRDPEIDRSADEQQPGIIASVGSSAVGNTDIEPQTEPRPDNDGETVGDE